MQIIQPHYHAIARTAQDYERMAMSGVVAVAEPAFWAGFDRAYPETFLDYFRQISEFEPTRAAEYGIRHFCWVAVNPKEWKKGSMPTTQSPFLWGKTWRADSMFLTML